MERNTAEKNKGNEWKGERNDALEGEVRNTSYSLRSLLTTYIQRTHIDCLQSESRQRENRDKLISKPNSELVMREI